MRLTDFITIEGHRFSERDEFKELIQKFLQTSVIKPFTEAVLRNKEIRYTVKEQLDPLFIKYWNTFTALPEYKTIKYWFDQTLEIVDPEHIPGQKQLFAASISKFSRHPDCLDIEKAITRVIIDVGLICLSKEHIYASKELINIIYNEGRIPDIFEYFNYCKAFYNQESHYSHKVTIQQMIAHLNIIKDFILPFKNSFFYTEHRKQAIKLNDIITKIFSQIRDKENSMLERNAEVEMHESYKARVTQKYFESSSQHDGCPMCSETPEEYAMLNQIFLFESALDHELNNHGVMIIDYQNLFRQVGDELIKNHLFKELKQCMKYWNDNLPYILTRKAALLKLSKFIPVKGHSTIIYRIISQEEVESLKSLDYLSQSERSSEREKWFYTKGGNPSVPHEYTCEITLFPGGYELLIDLICPDGKYAAVTKKENEPFCFGIHEDALPYFNNLVQKISIKKKGNNKILYEKVKFFSVSFSSSHLINDTCLSISEVPYLNPNKDVTFNVEERFPYGKYVTEECFKPFHKILNDCALKASEALSNQKEVIDKEKERNEGIKADAENEDPSWHTQSWFNGANSFFNKDKPWCTRTWFCTEEDSSKKHEETLIPKR